MISQRTAKNKRIRYCGINTLFVDRLFKRKNVRAAFFYYLTFYEHLCMTLLTDVQSVGKIAEDIGRLYCEKTYLDENDLSWIVSSIDNANLKALIKKIQKINIRSSVR